MFGKLVMLAILGLASAATIYPDGVDPTLCPNYPYCDVSTLGSLTYRSPVAYQYQPVAYGIPTLGLYPQAAMFKSGEAIVEASMPSHAYSFKTFAYPAGASWDHPDYVKYYENTPLPTYRAAAIAPLASSMPLPAKYPAGVDPATCPNYPLC